VQEAGNLANEKEAEGGVPALRGEGGIPAKIVGQGNKA